MQRGGGLTGISSHISGPPRRRSPCHTFQLFMDHRRVSLVCSPLSRARFLLAIVTCSAFLIATFPEFPPQHTLSTTVSSGCFYKRTACYSSPKNHVHTFSKIVKSQLQATIQRAMEQRTKWTGNWILRLRRNWISFWGWKQGYRGRKGQSKN